MLADRQEHARIGWCIKADAIVERISLGHPSIPQK
jgi:hypothetical protein